MHRLVRAARRYIPLLALSALMLALSAHTPAQAQSAQQRCFPETGFCISQRIYEYWQQNGGLPVFGFPVTRLQTETIEGRQIEVQWFERARLELHPENARPYDVLLGRLGGDALTGQAPAPRETPRPGCRFFTQTGINVCEPFLSSWRANGLELDGRRGKTEAENLALFGLPLTGEVRIQLADGKEYTVQWFERARFELHPENAPPFNVLLGQLGRDLKRPTLPGEDAALVAAIRAQRAGQGLDFTVENICIDRDLAFAVLFPVLANTAEPGATVLRRTAGGWEEIFFGPGFALAFRDTRSSLNLPDDFTCLGPPLD